MENSIVNDAGLLAALGIVSACVAALVWVIRFMFGRLVPMIEELIKNTAANTSITESADKYLRDRNGRDSEHHKATLSAINKIPTTMKKIADAQAKAIIKAVDIREQHVEHQHIDKQTLK